MATFPAGVVYSTASGMIRRWIVPGGLTDFNNPSSLLGPGESLYIFPSAIGNTLASAATAIQAIIGKPVPSSTCAVIDKNNVVVNIINADPAIDSLSGYTLISAYSPSIGIGCTYDPNTGLFTTPITTIPIGTVIKGVPTTQIMQSGGTLIAKT